MKKLSNSSILIYSDENYSHAVNYSQPFFNDPITVNFGAKHERTKYILGAGNQDVISIYQDGIFLYVIGQNNGMEYISLTVINTEFKSIEGEVFLNGEDCTLEENYSFGILDMDEKQQIKIMCEYL